MNSLTRQIEFHLVVSRGARRWPSPACATLKQSLWRLGLSGDDRLDSRSSQGNNTAVRGCALRELRARLWRSRPARARGSTRRSWLASSWVLLSIVSYPFAYTFASLSARKPEAGGIYSFTKESFGLRIATVTGWLFALWFIAGGPAVMLIAASYVAYAFPMSRAEPFVVAGSIIFSVFV